MATLIRRYADTGMFEYVEPDYTGYGAGMAALSPNDAFFFRQWALKNTGMFPSWQKGKPDADIDMDEAWSVETGDSSIIISILDTGVRLSHPEIESRLWMNPDEIPSNGTDDDNNNYVDDIYGWDFANSDNDPTDDHGHGTNVTGILGAIGNNSIGYAGVDWHARLMIHKILNADNWGYYSWWASAIVYSVDKGARVINMSVGGESFSQLLKDAVDYAYQNNVTIVVSMMNANNDVPYYPAAYSNTIAVGATDTDDTRANPFFWGGGSNYGAHIDVVAPGNIIYGLNHESDTDYDWYWGGTSQAAPHVAGLASLLLAQDNSRTPDDIRAIIRNTAEDQVGDSLEDTPGWDPYYGYGRINAYNALTYAYTAINESEDLPSVASILTLQQNYPNPFNASTTIQYTLYRSTRILVSVYDVLGRRIREIVNDYQSPGEYRIDFDAKDLSGGIYYLVVEADKREKHAIKMFFVK
ncbi:MAG: S8 family serine peptidase [Calditrichaeota bacterium]|nr:S8 family serine peptidase [Calditrichota bacterium]